MGMANFGAYLGGLSQGQQQAAQQAERKQYLQMLLAKQQKADADTDSSNEAEYKANLLGAGGDSDSKPPLFAPIGALSDAGTGAGADDSDSGLDGSSAPPPPAQIPGQAPMQGGPQPLPPAGPGMGPPQGQPTALPPGAMQGNPNAPQGGAMAPQPGQGSVPAGRMMPRPMPPQAGGPPPQQQIPGQRPAMPPQQAQAGPGGPPQPRPQGAPQPGQQPPQAPQPQNPASMTVDQGVAQLQQLNQTLQQPLAQKVLSDPDVKAAHDATTKFVQGLQKDNVGFGPGQRKPNAVEMKELQILHSRTELAATKAAKDVATNEGDQVKIATAITSALAKRDQTIAILKGKEDTNATREHIADEKAAGAGAGAQLPRLEDLNDSNPQLANAVRTQMSAIQTTGKPIPSSAGRSGGAGQLAIQIAVAELGKLGFQVPDAVANKAADAGDQKAETNMKGRLALVNDVSGTMAGLEPQILAAASKVAQLPGMSSSMKLNDLMQKAQTQFAGNGDVQKLITMMQGYKTAYSRLISQNTGAGGSTVESLRMAKELIDGGMPVSQMQGTFKGTAVEREATKKALQKVIDEADKNIQQRGRMPAAGAGKAGGAGNTAGFEGQDGTVYTDSDVAYAMKHGNGGKGMTRDEVMKAAGVDNGAN